MAYFQNEELEYMVDDYYDMDEFEHYDRFQEENQRPMSADGSDIEDDDMDMVIFGWSVVIFRFLVEGMKLIYDVDLDLQNKQKTDTSALEARNGKDIQGIPWERMNFTRDKYRETRLQQYKNYENLSRSREELEKVCFSHALKLRVLYYIICYVELFSSLLSVMSRV